MKDELEKRLVGPNRLIRRFYKAPFWNDEPKFYQYVAEINFAKFGIRSSDVYASGIDYFSETKAKIKALGEAIERFFSSKYDIKELISNSFTKLKRKSTRVIDPSLFLAFSKKQIKRFEQRGICLWKEDIPIKWTKATDLFTYEKVLIPAQLVYVPYFINEPLIRLPITTGCASHLRVSEAIYKGICECLERDSFMIYWLNKLSPPKIDVASINNSLIKRLIDVFRRYYLEWHVFFLKTDFPLWNIMSILIDKSNDENTPILSVGLSSDLSITKAIIHSASEAQLGRLFIRRVLLERERNGKIEKIKYDEIYTHEQRGVFWSKKKKLKSIRFLFKNRNCIKFKKDKPLPIEKKNEILLNTIKKLGYHCFLVKLGGLPVNRTKWKVIKILIPELCPLYLNEQFKYLGSKRIYELLEKLGFKSKSKVKINKLPHPFL